MQIEAIPMLINSDFFNAPLDIKMHLADYKMYGEDSYVFQQKELLHGLYECTHISMNDRQINGEALEYIAANNKHVGEALASVFSLERKDVIKTLRTMQAVLNSSTAITAVLNSTTAMTAVLNSTTAMTAVANSSTAMQAVLASSTAITEILKTNEYINEKMLTIMGKSKVALNTFKSSESLMIKFNKLSDVLRAKFAYEVEKKNINHEYYTSRHIIQSPTLLCEYTNGMGYTVGGAGTSGKSAITLVGESAQQNISVKNKFITDFDYNSNGLVSNNFGFPIYCKNVSIIYA